MSPVASCPICGSSGPLDGPGCGHCRPELRTERPPRPEAEPARRDSQNASETPKLLIALSVTWMVLHYTGIFVLVEFASPFQDDDWIAGFAAFCMATAGLTALATVLIGGRTLRRVEARNNVIRLLETDPVDEARKAVFRGDCRLYLAGGARDRVVPGYGFENEDCRARFGYKNVTRVLGEWVAIDDQDLKRQLIDYMRAYNLYVGEKVDREFAEWQARVARFEGAH
jgi:hypothetical protein